MNFMKIPKPVKDFNKKDSLVPNYSNMRNCVFRIIPRLRFDFYKDYRKSKQEYKKSLDDLKTFSEIEGGCYEDLKKTLKYHFPT